MEENENNVDVESTVNEKGNNIVEKLKAKKSLIICIVVAILVVLVVVDVLVRSPKETVKSYIKATNACKLKKSLKYMDYKGMIAFEKLDKDDYEDFWNEYKDVEDDDVNETKDMMEENIDEQEDEMKEQKKEKKASLKVKKITDVKKVGKHLYKVKAEIESKSDGEKDTNTQDFYVMKKGLKSYIVSLY